MTQTEYLASIATPIATLNSTLGIRLDNVPLSVTSGWTTDVTGLPIAESIPEPSTDDCEDGLSVKQMQAIGCLISGMSQTKTSEVCGVTRRTINHWNKLPEFKKVLRNRRREALQASMAILQNASVELALNLVKLAKTSFEPSDQIRATIQALKFANEQVFVEEITDRLDAIESSRNAPVTNGATYSVVKGNDET